MDFVEAFEGPVIEKIGGVDITFPPLLIDDYASWVEEITNEKKAIARKALPTSGIDPKTRQPIGLDISTRWEIGQKIESMEFSLEAVAEKVWTLAGAKRILTMSLAKSSYSPDDQKQIIARVKPANLHLLAVKVSGLFEKRPTPVIAAEQTDNSDPNSLSPAQNESVAGGATGSQTGA